MVEERAKPSAPDLTEGIALSMFTGQTLLGHVGDQDVLLVRFGREIFAVDAHCSHYHGPLAEGLVVGESIRCPWHHACFDLRTGEATRAPALIPLAVWQIEYEGDRIFVRQKRKQPKPRGKGSVDAAPGKVVIVGGGAAGFAAAERTFQKIISLAARRKNGCRWVQAASTLKPVSICGSIQRSSRSIPRHATSSSQVAAIFPSTAYCWRQVRSR
jgi:nitrite reductase/ring-hydroxylating ferredoxin subunit